MQKGIQKKTMFIVYGTEGCKYCDKTKHYLDNKRAEYVYHKLDRPIGKKVLNAYGRNTYPLILKIFDGRDRIIGGYEELCREEKNFSMTEECDF